MVGAQGVHQVDDDQGSRLGVLRHGRRTPEGALRLRALFVAAGLQHELGGPGVLRQVDVGRDPAPIGGVLEGVEKARPHDVLASAALRLHHELDPRSLVEPLADGAAEAEPGPFRQVETEAQATGRTRRKRAVEDFVQANGGAHVGEHRLLVEPGHLCVDESVAGGDEVQRAALGRAGGGPRGEGQEDESAAPVDQTPIMKDGAKPGQTSGGRAVLSCLSP